MLTITKKATSSDYQLAKVLQEQFQNEYETDKSADKLVYKKANKHNLNSSKCLVDPSWEVIDPTPDIHILFMAFDERFFWNKLVAVCVSWSKRMTTCAGICSYQGRGGMCSITLSEPLLKLRPRRDLVETLLHEMIHAYLFVTHNNRDRDGHGPEFHKHMYRINAESGTNITVYHDFHDEVRLYKQHWWKCNGPCQNWKPFYGMVKRAMNRAPAPTDRWWGEHSRTCGGQFIKIKEPEKPTKVTKSENSTKSKPETITKPLPDIRKHFDSNTKATTSSSNSSSKLPSTKSSITTINDLTSPTSKHSPVKTNNFVTGFPNTPGRTLSDSSVTNKDYSLVRNHWLNKFSNTNADGKKNPNVHNQNAPNCSSSHQLPSSSNTLPSSSNRLTSSSNAVPSSSSKGRNGSSNGLKRISSDSATVVPEKIPKLCIDLTNSDHVLVECPICLKKYPNAELNDHLDSCLNKTKECVVCDKNVPEIEYEEHVNECCNKNFDDDVFLDSSQKNEQKIAGSTGKAPSVMPVTTSSVKFEQCSVCDKPIESSFYALHLSECLQMMYQNFEDTYINKSSKCPVCDKEIPEHDLSGHLENCRDLSDIFDDDANVPAEEEENKENNCPICSKLVNIDEMNRHIDVCLNTVL